VFSVELSAVLHIARSNGKMRKVQNRTVFVISALFFITRGCERHFISVKGVPSEKKVWNLRFKVDTVVNSVAIAT